MNMQQEISQEFKRILDNGVNGHDILIEVLNFRLLIPSLNQKRKNGNEDLFET